MPTSSPRVTRRRLLKAAGAAAVGGGSAALLGDGLAAQRAAPAILTNTQAGRRFKAFVKFSKERPAVVDVTARGLTGNQVLLRVEAAQTCYSNIDQVLRNDERIPTSNATIVGHGGVGIVEAVGPQVISMPRGRPRHPQPAPRVRTVLQLPAHAFRQVPERAGCPGAARHLV